MDNNHPVAGNKNHISNSQLTHRNRRFVSLVARRVRLIVKSAKQQRHTLFAVFVNWLVYSGCTICLPATIETTNNTVAMIKF